MTGTTKIKIAIDISPTLNGNKNRGVGFYTSRLVPALQHQIKTNPKYKDWQISLESSVQNLEPNFDLVHYPYFDPFFLTLPATSKTPFIVTVHDLIPVQFKKHFPVGIKGSLKWLIQKHHLLQSKYIITDSHSSKYQINKYTNYPLDRIYTVYLASDPTFRPIDDIKYLNKIKNKYKLSDKFILYVGDINWNKNIPNLVKTCIDLKYPLVIVGSSATKTDIPIHPWTKDLVWLQGQQNPLIQRLGFVPDEELNIIYNLATLYCQPSYAEGFGLPPLEAMQAGCPIVYSKESSLSEVVDFNGVIFDPYKPRGLSEALANLWNNHQLQQKYSTLGTKRAKVFSWELTAIQTLSVYELALIHEKK